MLNRRCLSLLCLILALCAATAAHADSPQPFASTLVAQAARLVDELKRDGKLTDHSLGWRLPVQAMVMQFPNRPERSLAAARKLEDPFQASIALGAIAAIQLEHDPAAAEALLIEAEDRALAINHWTGSDPTTLAYLFQLIPLFEKDRALRVLSASHERLRRWEASEHQKSDAMLKLAEATLALNPDGIDPLLQELTASSQSNHYYASIQLLARAQARRDPERTRRQAADFYRSADRWPHQHEPIHAVLIEDALANLPSARAQIEHLEGETKAYALLFVARALHDAGRLDEARPLLTRIETHIDSLPPDLHERWHSNLASERRRWNHRDPAITPADIADFLAKPDVEQLRDWGHTSARITFANRAQAADFIDAALPLATNMGLEFGHPLHPSPRSTTLGRLAILAALLDRPARSRQYISEIKYPDLQALYLLESAAALRPLPAVLNDWPFRPLPGEQLTIAAGKQR